MLARQAVKEDEFQSQTGSIRRGTPAGGEARVKIQFQSQTGSIRSLPIAPARSSASVSIPNWFD